MFKYFIILLSVLCLQKEDVSIAWSEDYKLVWSDFQGDAELDSDAVAVTASGITFSYSIQKSDNRVVGFKTSVQAHFYPDKSWVKHERADAHILAHEQLHFDITELHARKFKYQISLLKVNSSIETELDQLHININKASFDMQNNYDDESDYSRFPEKQLKWKKHIAIELQKLSKFKS